jgi:OmpA-OmpF porin, OOP family
MRKSFITLLIAILALWLFGGAYWLSSLQNQNTAANKLDNDSRLEIRDGDFIARSSTIFAFQTSDADIIINEDQLSVLEALATYLDDTKEKQLRLIAYYGKNETNKTYFENLGIARAETVKNILFKRGAPESRISVEGKLFDKLILNENGLLSGGIEFDIFDKDISNTITEAPFLKEKIFYFKKNEYALSDKDDLENYTAVLKQHLVDLKDSEVLITGFREQDELQSIDRLRASFIEDVFIKHGIDLERILLDVSDQTEKDENIDDKKVEIKVL